MINLTNRETEVLEMLLQGSKNKDIAIFIGISNRTVELHQKHIYKKFNINSYRELIALEKRGELTYKQK